MTSPWSSAAKPCVVLSKYACKLSTFYVRAQAWEDSLPKCVHVGVPTTFCSDSEWYGLWLCNEAERTCYFQTRMALKTRYWFTLWRWGFFFLFFFSWLKTQPNVKRMVATVISTKFVLWGQKDSRSLLRWARKYLLLSPQFAFNYWSSTEICITGCTHQVHEQISRWSINVFINHTLHLQMSTSPPKPHRKSLSTRSACSL